MTVTAELLNTGNQTSDKVHVIVDGKVVKTLKRGQSFQISQYMNRTVILKPEHGNGGKDEYAGTPQVAIFDPPRCSDT